MGSIYMRGNTWWLSYYRNGVQIRESAETDKLKLAKDKLNEKLGDIARGVPVTPKTNRVTFDELMADVVNDYKVNGKKSLEDMERRIKLHLQPFFRGWKAAAITTVDVRKYITKRQEEKASNATVNRELAALKRGFTLALEAGKVTHRPAIPMLTENNVRKGFFDRKQFETLRSKLPPHIKPVVTFLYLTGWRVYSEVLPLQWRQVDFAAGTVRLDPGTTKNGEGRVFPMTAELRQLLEDQRAHTDGVQREHGVIIPHVFHHRKGKPITSFRRSWKTACKAAGCPGMVRHDFRRSAVRNLNAAGVTQSVAMKLSGHRTDSVYRRYAIVSEGDLVEAARRLDGLASTIPSTVNTGLTSTEARHASN